MRSQRDENVIITIRGTASQQYKHSMRMRHSASQGNIIIDLNDFITHSTKEKSGGGGGGGVNICIIKDALN